MLTLEIAEALEGAGIEHRKAYTIAETINNKADTTKDIAEIKDRFANLETSNTELKSSITELKSSIKWLTILILSINIPMFMLILGIAFNIFKSSLG